MPSTRGVPGAVRKQYRFPVRGVLQGVGRRGVRGCCAVPRGRLVGADDLSRRVVAPASERFPEKGAGVGGRCWGPPRMGKDWLSVPGVPKALTHPRARPRLVGGPRIATCAIARGQRAS